MPLRIKFATSSQEADRRYGQRRLDRTRLSLCCFVWVWRRYDDVSSDSRASSLFSTLQPGWGFRADTITSIPSLELFTDSPLSSGQSPTPSSPLKSILPFGIGLCHWPELLPLHSSQTEQYWVHKPSQVGFLPKLFMSPGNASFNPVSLARITPIYPPPLNSSWLPKPELGAASLCSSETLYLSL